MVGNMKGDNIMLNKEKYAKEIIDISCNGYGVAKQNGHLQPCSHTACSKCDFNTTLGCPEELRKWANSEYKEREIDWNKVPVDTPILITYSCYTLKRHFAKYYNKTIYSYPDGTTSWSFNQDSSQLISWDEKNVQIEKGIDCSEWYKD